MKSETRSCPWAFASSEKTSGYRSVIHHQLGLQHSWRTSDGTWRCLCGKRGASPPVTRYLTDLWTSWNNHQRIKDLSKHPSCFGNLELEIRQDSPVSLCKTRKNTFHYNIRQICKPSRNCNRASKNYPSLWHSAQWFFVTQLGRSRADLYFLTVV